VKNFNIAGTIFLLFGLSGRISMAAPDRVEDTARLSPQSRDSALPAPTPAAITLRALSPFLSEPLVVDAAALADSPRMVAARAGRVHVGTGDEIDVRGELHGVSAFRVVRVVSRLYDPLSGEYLGEALVQVGLARVQTAQMQMQTESDLHRFVIEQARQDIVIGDLLLPALPVADSLSAVMASHQPPAAVDAVIIAIDEGSAHAAQHQIVAINKGARERISAGAQFRLYATENKLRNALARPSSSTSPRPAEESGRLLIFRVFDRVSYGLITQAVAPIQVGDKAHAPHQ